ncbi:helix-turn-helix transcriptional regulator [Kibdelosporangium phytohabitans]|uniref:LuxR family transcriptional regulator n=1 Tax=Kibdelosporangium phytohabitans TaxID=860235 RepID=A0A0N9HR51_9PSEU|nr:helix-turn-helix transcriptional regulator [Kibdelosporangium phytohabitans]ALG09662.1 LuxR family transcriptional regulator [Kibdelosporangium phytohabitans]MBE1468992.1 DNA-binding CsgD family transcriptional regulator [Kibdelosporangium phytohabitans]
MLVGRDGERDHVERLLEQAAAGRSAALVIRGEAGIGKSALLDHAVATAGGARVVRGVGIESEAELAFGALHLLLYPFLDRLDLLPGPQAGALRGAFGLCGDTAPNPFLIGAAALTLLAELAAEKPLLCVVDDAQWLDRGSSDALLFAARRFQVDPVTVLFAVRDTAVPFHTPGIDELRLSALAPDAAAGLLDQNSPGLTAPMRARVLEEARGNPLALLELGAARLAAQRAGRAEPAHQVGPLPVTRRVQETFREQIVSLPEASQSMLLVAAADRFAEMDTVLHVARAVGADTSDLEAAERAGLISVADGELAFRHPLVRAAAYQCATHHQRIAVHRAFAEALTAPDVLDRRAWHLATATTGPDEAVAAELERTAQRAERRGGAMAVSAAYDRAGRLSVDPELKARRIAKAALAAYDAGKPDRAARLAVEVTALTSEASVLAEATLLRGQIEYERTSPEADAALASEAALLVMDSDPERAVVMLTEMICTGRDAGALPLVTEGGRLMGQLRLPRESVLRASAEAQISWGDVLSGRPENAAGPLRAVIEAGRAGDADFVHRIVAGFSGLMLAEDTATIAVMETMLAQVRASGALTWIPYAQEIVALVQALRGDFLTAQTCLAEAVALGTEFGMDMEVAVLRATSVWLAAATGDEPRCRELAAEVLPVLEGRHAVGTALTSWGLGLLDLAAGRYGDAFVALHAVCVGPAKYDFLIRAVPDLVEAAVRDGAPARCAGQFVAFERWAAHVDGPVATALLRRCQAMLDDSEEHYRAALDLDTGRFDRARTQLLYGEWLRRKRRRTEARAELDAALTVFKRLGASTWEGRATTELTALGERPALEPVPDDPLRNLTPQEVQVVRLAATGLSNKEIGAQLFLSPRTIGHHLYRAYPKLGVTRRIELAQLGLG